MLDHAGQTPPRLAPVRRAPPRLWGALSWSVVGLTLLIALHDSDHFVHPATYGGSVNGLALLLPLQYAAIAFVLVLVWRRHRRAPLLAVAMGAISILAFAGAHLLPSGPQPIAEHDPTVLTWTLIAAPMAVSALVVAAGLRLRALAPGR